MTTFDLAEWAVPMFMVRADYEPGSMPPGAEMIGRIHYCELLRYLCNIIAKSGGDEWVEIIILLAYAKFRMPFILFCGHLIYGVCGN